MGILLIDWKIFRIFENYSVPEEGRPASASMATSVENYKKGCLIQQPFIISLPGTEF